MSKFDFIIDGIVFSYSSVSTYDTCPYSFKLNYIDRLPGEGNFYSDYGSLTHEVMEQFFKGNLEPYELSGFYLDKFEEFVVNEPPGFHVDAINKYRDSGLEFFDNFSFDRDAYDVIDIETRIDGNIGGTSCTGRPDLVLRRKTDKKVILYDYKTSAPFWKDRKTGEEKRDIKKIEGYHKQMYLYGFMLREFKNIKVDEITLWFTRANKEVTIKYDKKKEKQVIDWLQKTIDRIKNDEEFKYNNSETFFCDNICNVREYCEFRFNNR